MDNWLVIRVRASSSCWRPKKGDRFDVKVTGLYDIDLTELIERRFTVHTLSLRHDAYIVSFAGFLRREYNYDRLTSHNTTHPTRDNDEAVFEPLPNQTLPATISS